MSDEPRNPTSAGERELMLAAEVARFAPPLAEGMDTVVGRVARARHVLIGEASLADVQGPGRRVPRSSGR